MRPLLTALLLALTFTACADAESPLPQTDVSPATEAAVRTGAAVLAADGFSLLDGLRVGLITNHTARVDTRHLIDAMHAEGVEIGALFGPEHGLRGLAEAGEKVQDGKDTATGATVYSLYGSTRKPTDAMLAGLDALVFDIQDVGARFYTYISTMGLAMQAAAANDLPFIVLDRPNPLGGTQAEGFIREPEHDSFVGQFAIPVTHGLTVGELARLIQGEALLPGLDGLDLRIVEMEGWTRAHLWPDTGLPFLPTSPNIPDFETALVYPGAALFEGTTASEGRGTRTPFLLVGAAFVDALALADTLNARALPGVRFEPATFTPEDLPGMATNPKQEGQPVHGVRHVLTDAAAFHPVATGVHVLHAVWQQAPAAARSDFWKADWLAKLAGTHRLHEQLTAGARPEAIVASWQNDVADFDAARQPYLLYE